MAGARCAGSAHTGRGAVGASTELQRVLAPQPALGMEAGDGKEETPLSSALSRFQLSEDYGFLLPNPLVGDGRATVPVGCRKQQGNGGAGDVWVSI